MKSFLPIFFILTTFLLNGCLSSGSSISENDDPMGSSVKVHNSQLGLDNYLKRLSGVRVRGSGQYAEVRMRGESSLELPNEPLFVMDNIRLGRNFGQVYRIVDMNIVNEIRALHSTKATLYYGHDGYAGVIEISTEN